MKKFLLTALAASSTYIYAGGLDRDIYKNISGHSIDSIKNSSKFIVAPDVSDTVESYESPQSYGNHYGAHLRGYITVPADGNYEFYLVSDDKGELLISLDGTASNKQQIASVSGWTGYHEFDKYESQKSAVFALQAGQKIYTEAFVKEGGGGDHLVSHGLLMEGLLNLFREIT